MTITSAIPRMNASGSSYSTASRASVTPSLNSGRACTGSMLVSQSMNESGYSSGDLENAAGEVVLRELMRGQPPLDGRGGRLVYGDTVDVLELELEGALLERPDFGIGIGGVLHGISLMERSSGRPKCGSSQTTSFCDLRIFR